MDMRKKIWKVLRDVKRQAHQQIPDLYPELDSTGPLSPRPLHETPPAFARLPGYSDPQQHPLGAQPYRIAALDPRPDLRMGQASVHEFAVDAPIPTITIPLNAGDRLAFDFGLPYRRMSEGGLFGYNLGYRELPQRFDRYSGADRRRIALRMLATVAAAAGYDLEGGPFPVRGDLTLDEALALLSGMKDRATPAEG
jgi:hypothetical protein